MKRHDNRSPNQLRQIKITPNILDYAESSVMVEFGNTRVICSAGLEMSVPPFLKNSGRGWLTAEYAMLPGSSGQRIQRERSKLGGRTQEIQRLIGRSLRMCIDFAPLGERSILLDCDVMDADGGTRTAAITGAYVALGLALKKLSPEIPALSRVLKVGVAAVSVGMVSGTPVLDLNYIEDKDAEVDMNVVMTSEGEFVEVQGTAENKPFQRKQLDALLDVASSGLKQIFALQQAALK